MAFPVVFYLSGKVMALVVSVPIQIVYVCDPVASQRHHQLGPKLHLFTGFPPDDGADVRLTDTDYSMITSLFPITKHFVLLPARKTARKTGSDPLFPFDPDHAASVSAAVREQTAIAAIFFCHGKI